jgi:hypothetical protein
VASISKISDSPEMEPWRLHNSYDRPIPRRIAEAAGVDRGLFGVRKKMVSTSQAYPSNARLRKGFFDFLEKNYRLKPGVVHMSLALGRTTYVFLRAVSNLAPVRRSKLRAAWTRTRLQSLERKPILGKDLDLQSLLFLWSTDTLTRNTSDILQKNLSSSADSAEPGC